MCIRDSYVTAGTKVTLSAEIAQSVGRSEGDSVKAVELSGANGILFRRNSVTGAVEAVKAKGVELNAELHNN